MAGTPSRHAVRSRDRPVRVLVVDDEPALVELMALTLRREGWDVSTAGTGFSAMLAARRTHPDLVVLDVALPDTDGLTLMRTLRTLIPDVPVLLLSGRASVEDRIAGLAHGGDDYVTKPFSLEEVVLRLRGLAMRSGALARMNQGRIVVGDLVIDRATRTVTRAGIHIDLTATEFKLLEYLMRNAGRIVAKSQILHHVWQSEADGNPNLVETFVSYLRRKVDTGHRPMIHTVRGSGYVLQSR